MTPNRKSKNAPVHSWPRVKILTPRHLCENRKWRKSFDALKIHVSNFDFNQLTPHEKEEQRELHL